MEVDPRKTTVDLTKFGEDKGNNESYFTFTARDKNGNSVESSNTIFGSKIINNESGVETAVIIEAIKGGNYKARFPVLSPGVYLVVLGVASSSKSIIQDMVKGSPYTVRVGADPTKPKKIAVDSHFCFVFGPGAIQSVIKRKSSFVIQACGPNGEKLKTGGDIFRAKIIPPVGSNKLSNLPCNLVDQLDGTYTVTYAANAIGDHTVHITESDNDTPIRDSPFIIRISDSVSPGEEVDANTAKIEIGEEAKPMGGSSFAFPISVKSLNGGKMNLSIHFKTKILNPLGIDVQQKIQECEDGNFILKFSPKDHGVYQFEVEVCINGHDKYSPVSGTPSLLDLRLSIDDDGAICAAKVLKVSPIIKQQMQEKKYPVSAPTSPAIEALKLDMPIKTTPLSLNNKPAGGLGSGSNSNLQTRVPPKNPSSIPKQRRFSSPPPVSFTPLSPPPKNPAPGSPSLSANPPSWLVGKK